MVRELRSDTRYTGKDTGWVDYTIVLIAPALPAWLWLFNELRYLVVALFSKRPVPVIVSKE